MDQTSHTPPVDHVATIPVHEEQLQVGVRAVETGSGVRVHTVVVERTEPVDVMLARDEFIVTRVPVDRFVDAGEVPAQRQDGDTLIMPVVEEVLVVERRLRIKEELHITKVRREERHVDSVVLKSEEVRVERFDEQPLGE